ncbi:MAG TPA: HAD family phosphatase [candidate division Zixibacteria bacterium]|nr:HAD family phosphatase [candidate division Zixibacteria bacterium]
MIKSEMIKSVIFDVGGVLVRSGDRKGRTKWEQRLGLNEWESEEIIFNSEMGRKAQLGEISDETLWEWAASQFDLSPEEFEQFREDFWADNAVDRDMIDMIKDLRPAYQTAIISNATDTLREDLKSRYQILDVFDHVVCSAEEKTMKPGPEIYLRTIELLKNEPGECIFIDDMEENVTAARKLDMKAIHFTPDTDLSAELSALGVMRGG